MSSVLMQQLVGPTSGPALVYNGSNLWVNGVPAYANTANSVALANVVGAGNIASINLDGNVSNALLGNGSFGPVEVTSNIISNGTSNVSIPVANGNVNISTNGNANIAQFDTNGALFLYPTTSSTNGLRINSYGNPTSGDVSRIASYRARGNAVTPLSVQPNDNLMRLIGFGHNGTATQLSSTASIRAVVDAGYTANGANIPIGWNMSVNDTNGGVNNQAKTHNFYSNGNVVFANSVFAVDSFTSGGNITSNIGVFNGNGAGLTNLPVANITGLGNIATLNLDGNASNVLLGNGVFSSVPSTTPASIANGTSNINIPVANGNAIVSIAGNANVITIDGNGSMFITPKAGGYNNFIRMEGFGRSGNVGGGRVSWQRARGNITTPLSMQPNDVLGELFWYGHNGTAYQTSSISRIQSIVDSSYIVNTTNIPLGIQIQVNDTNGGVNNQIKTHNFYANGSVQFASNVSYSGTLNLSKYNETSYVIGNVSGTVTPDLNNGSIQSMTLIGNITLSSLANVVTGSSATLKLVQDGTGNRTLTSTMKFATGFKTLSTAPNSVDIISVFYDGADYYATLTTGYQ